MLSRIFEPFFTTKTTDRGSGLGLSMAFGFISQSGGHISVDSEPGSGTTFRLFLPRAATAATAATPDPPVMRPLDGHGETVLVVEDNAALRRVAVRQLTRLGYAVSEAETAEAALCHLGSAKVQVLLTDVVMPGGTSGFELAQHAREVQPDIKVLLTSGFPEGSASPAGRSGGLCREIVAQAVPDRRSRAGIAGDPAWLSHGPPDAISVRSRAKAGSSRSRNPTPSAASPPER